MKFIIFSTLSVLLLLWSCSKSKYPDYFKPEYLGHFPRNENYVFRKSSQLIPGKRKENRNGAYLKKTYELTNEELDQLVRKLDDMKIVHVKHTDDCNIYIREGLRRNPICNNYLPLPIFAEEMLLFNSLEEGYLPNDFELYVIETQSGIYLNRELLSKNSNMTEN